MNKRCVLGGRVAARLTYDPLRYGSRKVGAAGQWVASAGAAEATGDTPEEACDALAEHPGCR